MIRTANVSAVTEMIIAKLAVGGPSSSEDVMHWVFRHCEHTATTAAEFQTALDALAAQDQVILDRSTTQSPRFLHLSPELHAALFPLIDPEIQLGFYEHYKSQPGDKRYYQIVSLGSHTETGDEFVCYIPRYLTPGVGLALRPRELFLCPKLTECGWTRRFAFRGHRVPDLDKYSPSS